jgi:hypothetical protein
LNYNSSMEKFEIKQLLKKELVDYARKEFNLSLNVNDTKKSLEAQIKDEESKYHLESVPGEGFVWVKNNEQKDSFEEDEPAIRELKRETEMLKNSLELEREIRRKADDKKDKLISDTKTWLVIAGFMALLAMAYLAQDEWLCSGYDCIAI